jgi:folate-binding protein YgfZ
MDWQAAIRTRNGLAGIMFTHPYFDLPAMHAFFDSLSTARSSPLAGEDDLAVLTPLPEWRSFAATGPEAAAFLHGQLTNDVEGLTRHNARLAGYCTAKGRLLATMVIWRGAAAGIESGEATDTAAQTIYGLLRDDLFEAVLKRLTMFVLRAKLKLIPVALNITGVTVPKRALAAFSAAAGGTLPETAWARAELLSGTWIAAPAAHDAHRFWWIATDAQCDAAAPAMKALSLRGQSAEWRREDLTAGLAWIGASTQDVFIPQTINLDLIDGVSFTKGCYPGQEVVARSHYRGTVKRRMALGTIADSLVSDVSALPGTDVYDAARADEPCGRVVDAAGATTVTLLFETTLASLPQGDLHLGSAEGPRIALLELPYAIA